MQVSMSFRRSLVVGLIALTAVNLASAALASEDYQPQSGQEGKDVVWVPSPQALVDRMLDLANVTSSDFVIDLGSGDGRTVISAAKRGARALGIEYNDKMVELSKRNAAKEGVSDKASFVQGDIFESDFSKASVITLFLLPELNLRLRPTLLGMKPGTRVVSNTFDMGEWQADETVRASGDCSSYCTAYFWIVPARVEGRWRTPQGEFALRQYFQMVSGTLTFGDVTATVTGRLMGPRIELLVGSVSFVGNVDGDIIEGTARTAAGEQKWRATRAAN